MNAKASVFVICIETVIIYLLFYNLQDCTFNTLLNTFSSLTKAAFHTSFHKYH